MAEEKEELPEECERCGIKIKLDSDDYYEFAVSGYCKDCREVINE